MATEIETILKLTVPVIVRVGERTMSFYDVLALGPGAIVELNKSADSELKLLVNNQEIGAGMAVKVGENFGIRVEDIGDPRDRVEAMAGD
jgi:flagellar motor switch protein FliN